MTRIMELESSEFAAWLRELRERRTLQQDDAASDAREILRDVAERGDRAVAERVARYDGVALKPEELLVSPSGGELDPELQRAVELACDRIRAYHARQIPREAPQDGELVERVRPLQRVGVYVPGGRAVYLSSLMMGAIPAQLAGVKQIVVATTAAAAATPELRAVCRLLGIETIYRGGASSIAAMAVGTPSLPRVDKIVGPGNRYVTALKQVVMGRVGIDSIAGPSEIAILADDSSDPRLVAADLLAQSEHGDDSSAVCICTGGFASRLSAEMDRALSELPPGSAAGRAFERNGGIVVAPSPDAAVRLVEELAPEHLSIQSRDAAAIAERIHYAGAIFVGPWSAVAIGDYAAGPNHILPTGGSARFFSALGVHDFLRRSHVVTLSAETCRQVGPAARILALREGLPLHARSIDVREVLS